MIRRSARPAMVALALCVSGCFLTGRPLAHRQPLLEPLAKRKAGIQVGDDRPPTPAPALYIPSRPEPVHRSVPPAGSPISQSPKTLPALTPAAGTSPSPALVQAPQTLPALAPAAATVPETPKAATDLKGLYLRAAQREASMDSYILRLRRREVVGGSKRPEEVVLFKFRRDPWSVYLKWLGEEGKGREVVYVKGRHGDVINTLTAAWDIPLVPAGKRIKVAPDSMLVRSKSRYPITEAGFTPLVQRFGRLVAAIEKGDPKEGSAKHLGLLKRPEFETKVDCVLQTLPPRSDPMLPRGGQRLWFFDPAWHLPVLIITQDETGREVEYYCHDRIQYPVRLDDADFDPDRLWKSAS